jgi:hypothetical protein
MQNQQVDLTKLSLDQLKAIWFDKFQLKQAVDSDIQTLNKVIGERISFENAAAKKAVPPAQEAEVIS